ncbi:MAG: LysR family transcriptional regulator [Alicyclobacillus sp.]|nr:LysR family transcriptional regulator [Alicyclobacillus sp.]
MVLEDLENISTFVAVASHLSFVKAAHALNLRQPSVSARIQKLEDRLGVSLFIRNNNHRIHLTEEGMAFLPYAVKMLQLMQEAENKVRSLQQKYEGKVRIGVTPTWAVTVLPKALGAVREQYPRVEFYVVNGTTKGIAEMILNNELDLGIVSYAVTQQDICLECVYETPWVLVCSPQHPLAQQQEVSLELVLREPLVTYEQGTPGREAIERIYTRHHTLPNIVAQLDQLEAAKAMVMESSCVSFLPLIGVQHELRSGRLVRLHVRQLTDFTKQLYVICLKAKTTYLLIDMVRRVIAESTRRLELEGTAEPVHP